MNKIEVLDEFTACPYCMSPVCPDQLSCCGESRSHFQKMFEVEVNGIPQDELLTEEELAKLRETLP